MCKNDLISINMSKLKANEKRYNQYRKQRNQLAKKLDRVEIQMLAHYTEERDIVMGLNRLFKGI